MKFKLPEKPNISRRTATVIILTVTSAVLFGLIIFGIFDIRRIGGVAVFGESVYEDEFIIELSGIKPGDKVSSLDVGAVEERILLGAPRIKSVRVRVGLFGDAVLELESETPKYFMALKTGEYFLLSDGFRIIGTAMSPEEYEGMDIMRISIPNVSSAVVGEYVQYKGDTEVERTENKKRAADFIAKISELCGKYVTAVGFEDVYSGVYVVLEEKYKIELGNMNDTERKIKAALETIKAHGEETKCAIVNAADYSEIYYTSVENIEY